MATVSEPGRLPTPTPTSASSNSTQETNSFEEFKKVCGEHGLLDAPAGIKDEDVRDGINDDATLLRFYTCRQFDIPGALKQFQTAYTARQVNRVSDFYENIEIKDYEKTRKIYPHWTGRRDKRGLPICTFDISKLDPKTMAAYRTSSASMPHPNPDAFNSKTPGVVSTEVLRSFAFFDGMTRFIMPLCSAVPGRPDPEKPITKALILAEISGVGMKQIWDLRGYIQDFSKLMAINYPEILDRVLITGAPSYLPTILRWVRPWIDPVTFSKLHFISPSEALPTMTQYIDIANIPRRYGGKLDYEHGSTPARLDPSIDEMLKWETAAAKGSFPEGPMKWVEGGEQGEKVAVAVGREGGEVRSQRIAVSGVRKGE